MEKSGNSYLYLHLENQHRKKMDLIGVHECKVDTKGRLMLPSVIRQQLSDSSPKGFIVKRSVFQKCLELIPRNEWETQVSQVSKLNRFVKKNNDFIRLFMAGVREITPDNSGRILIPKELINYAGIEKEIVLASSLNCFEIWDTQSYNDTLSADAESFAELAEQVMGNIDISNDVS